MPFFVSLALLSPTNYYNHIQHGQAIRFIDFDQREW